VKRWPERPDPGIGEELLQPWRVHAPALLGMALAKISVR
jgi:hypothetical protein